MTSEDATLYATLSAGETIVIFTSDNGGERFSGTWPFSGKKTELLEGGLRIPAIISAGRVSEQVTTKMDWLPTLLAAAGWAPDPAFPPGGMNLLPHPAPGRGAQAVLALQGAMAARGADRRLEIPQFSSTRSCSTWSTIRSNAPT